VRVNTEWKRVTWRRKINFYIHDWTATSGLSHSTPMYFPLEQSWTHYGWVQDCSNGKYSGVECESLTSRFGPGWRSYFFVVKWHVTLFTRTCLYWAVVDSALCLWACGMCERCTHFMIYAIIQNISACPAWHVDISFFNFFELELNQLFQNVLDRSSPHFQDKYILYWWA